MVRRRGFLLAISGALLLLRLFRSETQLELVSEIDFDDGVCTGYRYFFYNLRTGQRIPAVHENGIFTTPEGSIKVKEIQNWT